MIAVDVGGVSDAMRWEWGCGLTAWRGQLDDNSPRNFGDTVSGWWILLNRWNPFSSTRNIPAITEIQSRLA